MASCIEKICLPTTTTEDIEVRSSVILLEISCFGFKDTGEVFCSSYRLNPVFNRLEGEHNRSRCVQDSIECRCLLVKTILQRLLLVL